MNEFIPKHSHILHCSYSNWYPKYKSITPRSQVLKPLPQAFIDYLLADGIVLPDGDLTNEDEDEEVGIENPCNLFEDFHKQVQSTIQQLSGKVTPKLNWSSPKDALWISTTSTSKCSTASDIYLLLKSSDFITHDLTNPFDGCETDVHVPTLEYELVLRKWFDINRSGEFRCFVKQRTLVAQRDANYYAFLSAQKNNIQSTLATFFTNNLKSSFVDENFVFDAYIAPSEQSTWLVDINPFAAQTDGLLFTWEEILSASITAPPEIRLVSEAQGVHSFSAPAYQFNQIPRDVIDASAHGENIAEFAQRWNKQLEEQIIGDNA